MEDASEPTATPARHDFKSRPGALIWFFHKSRDGWKRKHQELKATVKGYKNRIADLTKSRDLWRLKAEQAAARIAASEAEITALRTRIAASEQEKNLGRQSPIDRRSGVGYAWKRPRIQESPPCRDGAPGRSRNGRSN